MNQPDALLATKLHVPRVRPGLIPRRRLTSELSAGLDHDLTLVVAPAGYGKSIAVTQWAASISPAVSWLSLDAQDNDPVRFWRHVLAALDTVRPGTADRVGPLAGLPPPATFDGFVTALINDVVTNTGAPADTASPECVLVLDDYHLIAAEVCARVVPLPAAAPPAAVARRGRRSSRPAAWPAPIARAGHAEGAQGRRSAVQRRGSKRVARAG